MPPSDTFFTAAPHWGLWVILYFFFGGIAGGSYFIASLIDLFGTEQDHELARIGYLIAFPATLLCAPLLIIDLNRPERFWHMLVQSETFWPMFKWWSPMSVGAWALLVFGFFTLVCFICSLMETGRLRWERPSFFTDPVRHVFNAFGALAGFFLASYTGVLLSVTNRPGWADNNLIGLLFLFSAASTGAAAILLFARRRTVLPSSRGWISSFDAWMMVAELVTIALFIVSLGAVAQIFLNAWGVLLLVGVVLIGILVPLVLHLMPRPLGGPTVPAAAVLVLLGGFILRAVIVLSAQSIAG